MILENNGLKIIVGKNVPETDRPIPKNEPCDDKELLHTICSLIREGGYDPVSQLMGFLVSDDPTHISNYNNARTMMNKIDRDELLSDMVRSYLESLDAKYGRDTDDDK